MEGDIVEESASKEEQLESDLLKMELGDCFVALNDEEKCVDECTDVDDGLQIFLHYSVLVTIHKVTKK